MCMIAAASPALTEICSPTMLLQLLSSPSLSRPPGFESSPTPPLVSDLPLQHTPPCRDDDRDAQPSVFAPLFQPRQEPILPSPRSPPPRALTTRRKTLAGVTISHSGGISLRRTSARARAAAAKKTPAVAKSAELLVCHSLGIVRDGEDITATALDMFADMFKEQLPPDAIEAMRAMFKLEDQQAVDIEDTLIDHGGAAALDHGDAAAASAPAAAV